MKLIKRYMMACPYCDGYVTLNRLFRFEWFECPGCGAKEFWDFKIVREGEKMRIGEHQVYECNQTESHDDWDIW